VVEAANIDSIRGRKRNGSLDCGAVLPGLGSHRCRKFWKKSTCNHCRQIQSAKRKPRFLLHTISERHPRCRALNLTRVWFLDAPRARHGPLLMPPRPSSYCCDSARRGFHEGVGELILLAASRCRICNRAACTSSLTRQDRFCWMTRSHVHSVHVLLMRVMPLGKRRLRRNLPLILTPAGGHTSRIFRLERVARAARVL